MPAYSSIAVPAPPLRRGEQVAKAGSGDRYNCLSAGGSCAARCLPDDAPLADEILDTLRGVILGSREAWIATV